MLGGTALAGCSQLTAPNTLEPIRPVIEPKYGNEYLLYRPSNYDAQLAWPLVVVCHGSFTDSPKRQIAHWTDLAESRGFLVVAPRLAGAKGMLPPKAPKQLALQRQDEQNILAAIRHVRAGQTISSDRIFIHGYAGGAYPALHTGLKHPELFRAVSLISPKFKSDYMTDVSDRADPHQPVCVSYSNSTDAITGKHAHDCADWLRSKGTTLFENSLSPGRPSDTRQTVEFYEEVTRNHPWLRIRAFTAGDDNPLAIRFKLRSSYTPSRYRWDFGDGDESPVAEPIHIYAQPGTYLVTVTTENHKGREDIRRVHLDVPEAIIRQVKAQPDRN
jgi:predicted esterase